MELLETIGFWIAFASVIISVVGYFVFPKLIKAALNDRMDSDSDSSETDS